MHRLLFIYQFPKSNVPSFERPSQRVDLLLPHKVEPFGTSTYWIVSLDSKSSPLSFIGLKVLCLYAFIGLKVLYHLHFNDFNVFCQDFNIFFTFERLQCLLSRLQCLLYISKTSMSFVKTSMSSLHFKDYQCLLSRLQCLLYISKTSMSFVKTSVSSLHFKDFNVFFTFQRLSMSFVKTSMSSLHFQRLQCLLSRIQCSLHFQRLQCLLSRLQCLLYIFKDYQSLLSCRDFNVFCFYISKTIKVFCLVETLMSSALTFQRLSKSFVLQRLQCLLPLHFKDYQSLLSYIDFNVFCLYISKTIKVFCLAETSMSSAFTFQRLSKSFAL